jgi:C4-dicarboxylate transporter
MPNPHNLKDKGFDKKPENINRKGRPRKWISEMKDQGYSLSEVTDAIQVLISLDADKLQEVKTNPKSTVLEVTIASAILKSISKGDLDSIETLLTRVFGKPKEKVEQDIKITNHTIKLKFGNGEE